MSDSFLTPGFEFELQDFSHDNNDFSEDSLQREKYRAQREFALKQAREK